MSDALSILDDVVRGQQNREDMARWYQFALLTQPHSGEYWERLNKAIIKKWSKSGLEYIKKQAWKHMVVKDG